VTGANISSLDEYRAQDSKAVLLGALEDLDKEGCDGLVLLYRPPRGQPVRTWFTGEYSRHPAKARTLLSRVWEQLAPQGAASVPPITISGRL
jgi:hypothetical protein